MSRSPSKSFTTRVHTRRPGPLWLVSVNYQPYLAFWFHKWLNEMGLLFCRQVGGFHFMARSSIKRQNKYFQFNFPHTAIHTHTQHLCPILTSQLCHKKFEYSLKGQILQSCLPFKSIVQKFSSSRQLYLCESRPRGDHESRHTDTNRDAATNRWDGHVTCAACPLHYGCKIRYEIHTLKLSTLSPVNVMFVTQNGDKW